ncbi:KN motif and ankyrin repeat domain-containing protein 2-like [Synchiropus splendidus]|uniref:KN motif and ankyrin repeat domain-containing protein 2-like n=1 Tax=Synchiropus splendidus TaxID=270530 RepID=UPI00237DF1FA|nr:KN motif and ankyrin repeat domain-containing protein 2-like [Synchiropus splendidus]
MDKRGGNNKAAENGIKGADPYSVETPYGFQLDLDFLKYVDDIEKGNTIKRVPIQRRSKGPRASTLPRHLNTSAGGYRPSPWGSTGALAPRSDHHGNTSWPYGHRSPTGLQTMEEMEARIREFDAQPLGEYIRPNLLRASSLPLTVLLRQSSESADELGSIQSSRLGRGNTSCEDICGSTDSIQDNALLLRRLSEALERVQALEREVKVIPDLQSQISSLQEEKERLCLSLKPMNGTKDPYSSLIFNSMDSKRPRKASPVPPPGHYSGQYPNATQEWRNSSDLDELLTVTSLQAKVAALEQKLCETKQELQRVSGLLRRQQMEGCVNDSRIRLLSGNLGVWVEPERVVVDQDGDDQLVCAASTEDKQTVIVRKIKSLLDQQWECICGSGGDGPRTPPNPCFNSLQEEITRLVDTLCSSFGQHLPNEDGASRSEVSESKADDRTSRAPPSDATEGIQSDAGGQQEEPGKQSGQGESQQMECDLSFRGVMAAPPQDAEAQNKGTTPSPDGQMISKGSDGGGEADVRSSGSSSTDGIVTSDFMAACHFLSDHMENMENPNNEMRDALIVLFQSWFTTAAEEDSEASKVSVYVKEVKRATPTLLAFLVNLVDDNGNTVLHYSVSHCNYSIVSLLLDTGVSDVNLQNKAGYTPVMLASLTAPDTPFGMEVVRRLMEGGCINIRSGKTGQTALHLAVRHGRVVMVRLLLSCGADANVQDAEGTTALMFAAEKGYTHIARLLLERSQCDLTLTDERGRTALSIAKLGSHSDTSTLLQAHAKARALHC